MTDNAQKVLALVERTYRDLIGERFGERVIVLKASDGKVTHAEVTATRKHKLT